MSSDSNKLPVPYKPDTRQNDLFHHTNEWTSGRRGGGRVPADYEWKTNPKQQQEEVGVNEPAEKP